MKLMLYGTKSDRAKFEGFISVLPDLCYRKIQMTGFTDYDSFVSELCDTRPDCIVIAMDGADGMEGVIAARNAHQNVPVVWFSDDNAFGAQSYRLGCAYFHEKPISPDILSAAIAKCV